MRSTASWLFAAALAVVVLAAAACGGSDSNSLAGVWEESPGDMIIRFDEDGTWEVDADGSLDNGVFTGGTYESQGQRIAFTTSEGGMCRGDKLAWHVDFAENDIMKVQVVDPGCYMDKGFRTTLVRNKHS